MKLVTFKAPDGTDHPGVVDGDEVVTVEGVGTMRELFARGPDLEAAHEASGPRYRMSDVKLLPPIGPLRDLKLKMPTAPVEKLFMESFDRSTKALSKKIDEEMNGDLHLEDKNYDVGVVTPAGAYRLDDNVQAYWLGMLAQKNFATVTPSIRRELLNYYSDLNAPIATKKDNTKWRLLVAELQELKTTPVGAVAGAGAP